jgi:hypothetical protein
MDISNDQHARADTLHASEGEARCHVGLCQVRYWATRDSRVRWQRRRDWALHGALATAHSWTLHATYANPVKAFAGKGAVTVRDARWPSLCDSGNVLRVADDAARTAIGYLDTTDQVRSGLAAFEAVWTAQ